MKQKQKLVKLLHLNTPIDFNVLLHCIYLTDSVLQSEIKKRDSEIKDLTEKYSTESKVRTKVEKQKDQLDTKLVCTNIIVEIKLCT